ncbi:hypothetical protein, partial [Flavobacterium cyanobacteriorum]|uniref:hypothetical protein n=1 Tax=Flavobacterium cyanobacteriorum TaxID=2022802 RepID=UPI001A9C809A
TPQAICEVICILQIALLSDSPKGLAGANCLGRCAGSPERFPHHVLALGSSSEASELRTVLLR